MKSVIVRTAAFLAVGFYWSTTPVIAQSPDFTITIDGVHMVISDSSTLLAQFGDSVYFDYHSERQRSVLLRSLWWMLVLRMVLAICIGIWASLWKRNGWLWGLLTVLCLGPLIGASLLLLLGHRQDETQSKTQESSDDQLPTWWKRS